MYKFFVYYLRMSSHLQAFQGAGMTALYFAIKRKFTRKGALTDELYNSQLRISKWIKGDLFDCLNFESSSIFVISIIVIKSRYNQYNFLFKWYADDLFQFG